MSEPSKLDRLLELVPLAWLALTLTAYWFVVAAPAERVEQLAAPVPGLAEADRAAAPLLAALLLVGIIRYFGLRNSSRHALSSPAGDAGRGSS